MSAMMFDQRLGIVGQESRLSDLLASLPAAQWESPVPGRRGGVREAVSVLTAFIGLARVAAERPGGFIDVVLDMELSDVDGPLGRVGRLAEHLEALLRAVEDSARPSLPWFGGELTAVELVARCHVELWAGTYDVAAAAGLAASADAGAVEALESLAVVTGVSASSAPAATTPDARDLLLVATEREPAAILGPRLADGPWGRWVGRGRAAYRRTHPTPVLQGEARVPLAAVPSKDPILSKVFGDVLKSHPRVSLLYRAIGAAPPMLEAWIGFAWRLRANCETPRDLRELVILRVAHSRHSLYELQQHRDMANRAGVSELKQGSVKDWKEAPAFTTAERAALTVADELLELGDVSDEAIEELRLRVGDGGVVEIVLTVVFYECVATFLRAMAIPLETSG